MIDRRNFFNYAFFGSCSIAMDYKTKINEFAKEIYKILTEIDWDQKVGDVYCSNIHADVDGNPKNGWEHVAATANSRENRITFHVTEYDGRKARPSKGIICDLKTSEIESDYKDKKTLTVLKNVFNSIKEKSDLKPKKK